VQRFRGGLVFKAHSLLYQSTLGLRVIAKKKKKKKIRFSLDSWNTVSSRQVFNLNTRESTKHTKFTTHYPSDTNLLSSCVVIFVVCGECASPRTPPLCMRSSPAIRFSTDHTLRAPRYILSQICVWVGAISELNLRILVYLMIYDTG